MAWPESLAVTAFWSVATVGIYAGARRGHLRWSRWWTAPLVTTPVLLAVVILGMGERYQDYIARTHWLVSMLGPATVAFAVPIWERRALLKAHWGVLAVAIAVGSTTAMVSSWVLARLVGLNDTLVRSLVPRSVTTPFAMNVSSHIGGVPGLTAVFVIVTGIVGASLGDLLLARLPVRSALARGAVFGMGAHTVGVARAHQRDPEEGAIAGVVMVLVGIVNVLVAPWLAHWIH